MITKPSNKQLCALVRELVPNYIEHLCTNESAAFLNTHLRECDACRAYCEALAKPIPIAVEPVSENARCEGNMCDNTAEEAVSDADITRFVRRHKRRRRLRLSVISLLLLASITVSVHGGYLYLAHGIPHTLTVETEAPNGYYTDSETGVRTAVSIAFHADFTDFMLPDAQRSGTLALSYLRAETEDGLCVIDFTPGEKQVLGEMPIFENDAGEDELRSLLALTDDTHVILYQWGHFYAFCTASGRLDRFVLRIPDAGREQILYYGVTTEADARQLLAALYVPTTEEGGKNT